MRQFGDVPYIQQIPVICYIDNGSLIYSFTISQKKLQKYINVITDIYLPDDVDFRDNWTTSINGGNWTDITNLYKNHVLAYDLGWILSDTDLYVDIKTNDLIYDFSHITISGFMWGENKDELIKMSKNNTYYQSLLGHGFILNKGVLNENAEEYRKILTTWYGDCETDGDEYNKLALKLSHLSPKSEDRYATLIEGFYREIIKEHPE